MAFQSLRSMNGVIIWGHMFVRSFIHSFVSSCVRRSRNVRLCTTNKRLDLEAPIFAHLCTLTMYLCLPIFIQILNVPELQFKGQIFESNTMESAYVKSVVFVNTTETTRTDDTNRDDVEGCHDMSGGVRICQGVSEWPSFSKLYIQRFTK